MTRECQSCKGTYDESSADGVRYFHVCPPLSDAEIARQLGLPADAEKWSDEQRAAVAAADRRRQDARDENIDPDKLAILATKGIDHATHADERDVIKAVGWGARLK